MTKIGLNYNEIDIRSVLINAESTHELRIRLTIRTGNIRKIFYS